MNDNKGIVYLIQPVELVKGPRFKIGCSKTPDLTRCKNGYNNGSRYICIMECYDPISVENELKKSFKQKFSLIGGYEYFEGEELQMRDEFYSIVKKCSEIHKNKMLAIQIKPEQIQNTNTQPVQTDIFPVTNTQPSINKSYSCELCDKHYKSYMGYWVHNKKKHNKNTPDEQAVENNLNIKTDDDVNDVKKKIYACRNCNKVLSCKQSRWKHEQTCKVVKTQNKYDQFEKRLEQLEKTQNIINNTTNNNTTNNNTTNNIQYIINSPSDSSIGHLTFNSNIKKPVDENPEPEQPKGFDDLIAELPDDEKPDWLKPKQPNNKTKPSKKLIDISDSDDSSLSSDDDSEFDEEAQKSLEIIIGGKVYILEDNKVYIKTNTNTKGNLYGTYTNGKIKKLQQNKDIDL